MKTLDGRTLSFPDDFKGKVVVLDYWATWCGPCVRSLPHIKEIYETYKDREVIVIGVSCDRPLKNESIEKNRDKVSAFVKKKKLSWPQAYSGVWPLSAQKYGSQPDSACDDSRQGRPHCFVSGTRPRESCS